MWQVPASFSSTPFSSPASSADDKPSTIKIPWEKILDTQADLRGSWANYKELILSNWDSLKVLLIRTAVILCLCLILLWVVMVWGVSRMNVMSLKCVMERKVWIRTFWRETADVGNHLFGLNMLGSCLSWVPLFVTLGIAVWMFFQNRPLLKEYWWVFLGLIVLFVLMSIVISVTVWGMNQFLPAQCLLMSSSVKQELPQLWFWVRSQPLKAVGILGLYWLTTALAGTAVSMMYVILAIPLLVVMAATVGLGVVLMGSLSVMMKIMAGLCLGLLFSIAVCLVIAIGLVPLQTFNRYLRIELVSELLLKGRSEI